MSIENAEEKDKLGVNKKRGKLTNNKKTKAFLFALILLIFAGWVFWGNVWITTSHYVVADPKIPQGFEGFTIAQISDLHNKEWGNSLIKRLKKESPDVIVITGDLIDSNHMDLKVALTFAQEAREVAPVFFVTGNHEAWSGHYSALKQGLIDIGVTVLEDEATTIEQNGDTITLLGLMDPAFMPKAQKKNEKEGLKLAKKAAEGESYEAMYSLGAYYKSKNDNDEAIAWYKKCADTSYQKRGRTHSGADKDLKELGVNYDPANSSSNNTATASTKTLAVGDNVDIYFESGKLCKTGKIVKKGSDYFVKLDNDELKLIPINEKHYSSLFDKDITYCYKVQMYDINMYIKDKIKGAPEAKSSSSSSMNNDDNCAVKDGMVVLYDRRGKVFMTCKLMEKNGTPHVKVDNGLYKIKAESRRFHGVTYSYLVLLGDGEYFIKGEIPGFKSGSSSNSGKSKSTSKKTTENVDKIAKTAKKVGNKVNSLKNKLKF